MRGTWTGLGLLFRLSALTLGAAFGSLLLGIWLDRTLGTAPFGTLCLMVIGILGGTIGIYRAVREANQQVSGAGHRDNSMGGT
jgi:F0F1-type ATP synthase assembly protein I